MPAIAFAINIAFYVSILSALVCFLTGVVRWNDLQGSIRYLIIHAGVTALMELVAIICSSRGINNHIYYNIYIPIEYLLMIFAARDMIPRVFRYVAIPAILIFAGVFSYDMYRSGPWFIAFHAITSNWLSLAVIYLLVLVENARQPSTRRRAAIYVLSGSLLAYYCCTVPSFSLFRYFINESSDTQVRQILNLIRVGLSAGRYFFTALAVWMLVPAMTARKARRGMALVASMPAEPMKF